MYLFLLTLDTANSSKCDPSTEKKYTCFYFQLSHRVEKNLKGTVQAKNSSKDSIKTAYLGVLGFLGLFKELYRVFLYQLSKATNL